MSACDCDSCVGGWSAPQSEPPPSTFWRASVHCPKCQREIDKLAVARAFAAAEWLWTNAVRICPKCGPVIATRKCNLIFGRFPALRTLPRGIEQNDNNDERTGT